MQIKHNLSDVINVKHGSDDVKSIVLGNSLIWAQTTTTSTTTTIPQTTAAPTTTTSTTTTSTTTTTAASGSASVPNMSDTFKATGVAAAKSQAVTSSGPWYAVTRNSSWPLLGNGSPPADLRMPTSGTLNSGDSIRYGRGAPQTVGATAYIDLYVGGVVVASILITCTA